ncbi:hypothetical protein [Psychrobacter vallis]|uniref:hypothetical protein n=1 Tax=Psychrobacter vallis TaxID=248451 RepID=UPI0019181048|nr:hypothetical protein [Psychrobacter vallis]
MDDRKIEVGDTWNKGALGVVIFGYTDDSCGFVIFRAGMKGVGWLGDYQMETEHVFRRDFVFSYADPNRRESKIEKAKRNYNQVIDKLAIK